jgi:hypothetical protein
MSLVFSIYLPLINLKNILIPIISNATLMYYLFYFFCIVINSTYTVSKLVLVLNKRLQHTFSEYTNKSLRVVRIGKSEDKKTQWPKENGQKYKQRSTKHYTEHERSSNTNSTNILGELGFSSCIWYYKRL